MKITYTIKETKEQIKKWKKDGYTVGFVPTMGALHEGHLSLVERSVRENHKTVVSIFVNPMQFSPSEDLSKYPRDFDKDLHMCEKANVDLIFNPSCDEMYGENFNTFVDMDKVTKGLCGNSRPTHFRGVCTVVNKLFNIITPERSYFGQKDAQQLAVIKKMVADLNMDIEIIGCPIVREYDGVAKSSRNIYLSKEERISARVLNRSILKGEEIIKSGERDPIKVIFEMRKIIETEPNVRIDYIEIVNSNSMEKIDRLCGSVLVAGAVFIGKTRLIDNFICEI